MRVVLGLVCLAGLIMPKIAWTQDRDGRFELESRRNSAQRDSGLDADGLFLPRSRSSSTPPRTTTASDLPADGIRTWQDNVSVDERIMPPPQDSMARLPITVNKGQSVNPKWMKVVEDNSIGIRYEERDLYFHMLELAQKVPFAKQVDAAADFRERQRSLHPRFSKLPAYEFPQFVDLFENPDAYHGRPVTMQGVLRQLTKFDPGPNEYGLTEVFEAWIYTSDSQHNPCVVVFARKPEGLRVGGDLAEEVRVTGYFMKMYGYEAQDVPRAAPLLIADAVEWRASSKAAISEPLGLEAYLLVGFLVLTLGYSFYHTNRLEMTRPMRPQPEIDFSQFPPREYSLIDRPDGVETDDA